MGWVEISDFKGGLDRRRSIYTSPAGTLIEAVNVDISRGGEIESSRAFAQSLDLTGLSTKALYFDRNGLLTFGSATTPVGLPAGIQYQQLVDPLDGAATLTRILGRTLFKGLAFVIAEFSNGRRVPFYDGAVVTDFTDGIVGVQTAAQVMAALQTEINASELVSDREFVTATVVSATGARISITGPLNQEFLVAGRIFDTTTGAITQSTDLTPDLLVKLIQEESGTQVAVQAVARMQVTGGTAAGVGVTAVTVNSVNLLNAAVVWATSNDNTATLIAASINAKTATTGYTATASSTIVTISAPLSEGATPNGYDITITTDANLTITVLDDFNGGEDPHGELSKIYEVEVGNGIAATLAVQVRITFGGETFVFGAAQVAGSQPLAAATLKGKVHVTDGSLLRFSALDSATDWDDALETAGFIDMSSEFSGADSLTALGVYQNNLAVFARRQTFVYFIDPDPAGNRQLQVLNNTGALSPMSVTSVGDLDVFYLSDTGVRSLRARDSSNSASVSDIGTPVDSLVVAAIKSLGDAASALCASIIEPIDGRYLLGMGDTVFAYSHFNSSKVSAWTTYDFTVTDFATLANRLYARSGDIVYLLGGAANDEFADDGYVILPFLDAKKPADRKTWTGIDATLEGEWQLYGCCSLRNNTVFELLAQTDVPTYDAGTIPANGEGTHYLVKMVKVSDGYARVGNLVMHFASEGEGD
jgi:hypothetical protein